MRQLLYLGWPLLSFARGIFECYGLSIKLVHKVCNMQILFSRSGRRSFRQGGIAIFLSPGFSTILSLAQLLIREP